MLFCVWHVSPPFCRFDIAESVLQARLSIIKQSRRSEQLSSYTDVASDALINALVTEQEANLQLSRLAREAGHLPVALKHIYAGFQINKDLKSLDHVDKTSLGALLQEQAFVLWSQGEHTVALEVLKRVAAQAAKMHGSEQATELSYPKLLASLVSAGFETLASLADLD